MLPGTISAKRIVWKHKSVSHKGWHQDSLLYCLTVLWGFLYVQEYIKYRKQFELIIGIKILNCKRKESNHPQRQPT